MNKDFKKFSLLDESIKTVASNSISPLPESVEESKDWTKPDENGDVDVPDYLMPLLNKLGSQLRFHTISGEGEAITLVRMTSIAEKFFKTHHSAEVERLREALKGIGNSAVYMINHEHQTVINSGLINHILETVNLALSQDALKEK